ncbi:MAG: zinc-ribbon domain-containing protein [Burkholderiaceae bacterium]
MSPRKAHLVGHPPLIMQVICSNCSARYAVDPSAIGPTGRTVQCVRCNHRWFQEPAAPPPPPPPTDVPSDAPPAPVAAVPDVVIRPSTPGAGLPALTTPPPPRRNWGTWIAFAIVFLVLFGAAGYAYRGEIKSRLPASWRTALQLDAAQKTTNASNVARAQVGIDMATTRIDLVDGRYIVLGQLINTGTAPGSTRRLKLVVRAGEQILAERAMPLVEGPIPPGARRSFTVPLDEIPSGATNIVPTVD